jgi:hypothetical protein
MTVRSLVSSCAECANNEGIHPITCFSHTCSLNRICVVSCMFLSTNTQQISDKCQANIALPDKVPLVVAFSPRSIATLALCVFDLLLPHCWPHIRFCTPPPLPLRSPRNDTLCRHVCRHCPAKRAYCTTKMSHHHSTGGTPTNSGIRRLTHTTKTHRRCVCLHH